MPSSLGETDPTPYGHHPGKGIHPRGIRIGEFDCVLSISGGGCPTQAWGFVHAGLSAHVFNEGMNEPNEPFTKTSHNTALKISISVHELLRAGSASMS